MRKKLFKFVCALVLALLVIFLWPTAGYDISRVYPKLRELSSPYQSVKTAYYLDGGSIGVAITDRDGHKLELALPVSAKNGRSYPQLFVGAMHASKTNAVEVEFAEDTRRMLISTIEEFRTRIDSDAALLALRGAPRDYAWALMHHYFPKALDN